ncbi:MAG: hypothetical protein O2955_06485 [Planctomycetota bacterium]|nr:hypothetical protein [Planctomycetota bacterium]MDA1212141.1 hypothetical protein [Planctomycetota bacterium]
MSQRSLIETATLVSARSAAVIFDPQALSDEVLYRYWRNARRCQQYWLSCLKPTTVDSHLDDGVDPTTVIPVIENLFAADVLIRLWSASLVAHDHVHAGKATAPIARNVLISQLQLRRYALEAMVDLIDVHRRRSDEIDGVEDIKTQIAKLDAFRRRCERWTDLLLGHLIYQFPVQEFAYDIERARDFGEQQLSERFKNSDDVIWQLIRGGVRLAFPDTVTMSPSEEEMVRHLVEGILSGFPQTSFLSTGSLSTLEMAKMARSAGIVDGLVTEEFLRSLPVHRILDKNPQISHHDFPTGPFMRF